MEKTLVILKPDALHRRLCGKILQRFEEKGLQIIAMKMMVVSTELAEKHYAEHREKPFFKDLVEFITAAPVIVIALKGSNAVSVVRKMMGATFGFQAEPGTIRGDFSLSRQNNLVHGSANSDDSHREIHLFFSPDEMVDFAMIDQRWVD